MSLSLLTGRTAGCGEDQEGQSTPSVAPGTWGGLRDHPPCCYSCSLSGRSCRPVGGQSLLSSPQRGKPVPTEDEDFSDGCCLKRSLHSVNFRIAFSLEIKRSKIVQLTAMKVELQPSALAGEGVGSQEGVARVHAILTDTPCVWAVLGLGTDRLPPARPCLLRGAAVWPGHASMLPSSRPVCANKLPCVWTHNPEDSACRVGSPGFPLPPECTV